MRTWTLEPTGWSVVVTVLLVVVGPAGPPTNSTATVPS